MKVWYALVYRIDICTDESTQFWFFGHFHASPVRITRCVTALEQVVKNAFFHISLRVMKHVLCAYNIMEQHVEALVHAYFQPMWQGVKILRRGCKLEPWNCTSRSDQSCEA